MKTLDLRPRCERCVKLIRGAMAEARYARYRPFCSFHCQEWTRLESAQRYINEMRTSEAAR